MYLKNKFINSVDFLNVDSDAIFYLRVISFFFTFKCCGSSTVLLFVKLF